MAEDAPESSSDESPDALVDYRQISVDELLELVATASPAPAGGSVAALVATLAAALAAMTARLSLEHWDGAAATAAQAQALRARLAPLAEEDAAVYLSALKRMRPSAAPEARDTDDSARRDHEIATALTEAAAVPLRIAEAAADVAELASDIARLGNPAVAADAVAAVTFARAAAEAAAHIVSVNLRVTEEDELSHKARRAVEAAEAASHRAYAAGR